MRLVVIGGGAIGSAVSLELARSGCQVALLERAGIGQGASHAAAGMLAPYSEATGPGPLLDAGLQALAELPSWIEEVEVLSGMRTDCDRCGTLVLATPDEQRQDLRDRLGWLRALDPSASYVERDLLQLEAAYLGQDVVGAARHPTEMRLDPERYTRALARAAEVSGAEIREGTPVLAIRTSGGKVVGVETPRGAHPADAVIVATGADPALLTQLGIRLPLRPVKGELLRLLPAAPIPGPNLFGPDSYVTTRADGSVVVGTTQLPGRSDTTVEAGSVAGLLVAAFRLVPALRRAAFRGAWAGVRPALPDLLPAVGPWVGLEGLWFALGHYRSGILLASWTATHLAAALLDGAPLPQSFLPERLLSATESSL